MSKQEQFLSIFGLRRVIKPCFITPLTRTEPEQQQNTVDKIINNKNNETSVIKVLSTIVEKDRLTIEKGISTIRSEEDNSTITEAVSMV